MEPISFSVDFDDGIGYEGYSLYVGKEYSLSYRPFSPHCGLTIILGATYVGLDVSDENGQVFHFTGYTPKQKWIPQNVELPNATQGKLYADWGPSNLCGVGITYPGKWPVYFDSSKNIVCLGDAELDNQCQYVEFAQGLFAGVKNNALKSLWAVLREDSPA